MANLSIVVVVGIYEERSLRVSVLDENLKLNACQDVFLENEYVQPGLVGILLEDTVRYGV